MLTTTLLLGPKDHGRAITDEELEIAASETYKTPLLPGLKLVIFPPVRPVTKRPRRRRS